jgi:hypothetical protein
MTLLADKMRYYVLAFQISLLVSYMNHYSFLTLNYSFTSLLGLPWDGTLQAASS